MKSPHHLEQQGPSSMNRYGKGPVTAVLGSGTGARGMKSPEEELRDRPPLPPLQTPLHLRICIWKAKVFVLGSSWAGLPRPLSSSEAVEGEIGDLVGEGHPGSPVPHISHSPFPSPRKVVLL